MRRDPEDGLEPVEEPEPEEIPEIHFTTSSSSGLSLKAKLVFWSMIIGGIAVGTFLFLFFLTLFTYVFLPVLAIYLAYHFLRRLMR